MFFQKVKKKMPIERFTLIIKRLLMLYFLSALKEGSRKWSNFCGNIQEWYTGNGTRLEYDAFLEGDGGQNF